MNQKRFFIKDWQRGCFTITELCHRYSISRKTACEWIGRFEEEGAQGLVDRSRRPINSPWATPAKLERMIVTLRQRHPTWGPKKLLWTLEQRHPDYYWPARSTIADILVRNDLITHHVRRRYPGHGGKPAVSMSVPNEASVPNLRFASGSPAPQKDSTKERVMASSQLTFILRPRHVSLVPLNLGAVRI